MLALIALILSAPSSARPVNSELIKGLWEGEMEVFHAPAFPDNSGTLKFRLEIGDDGAEFSIFREDANVWSSFNAPRAVGQFEHGAMYIVTNHTAGFNELISINVVHLNEARLYVYVSRVVDNFVAQADGPMRHFPVFSKGEMRRVEPDGSSMQAGLSSP